MAGTDNALCSALQTEWSAAHGCVTQQPPQTGLCLVNGQWHAILEPSFPLDSIYYDQHSVPTEPSCILPSADGRFTSLSYTDTDAPQPQ